MKTLNQAIVFLLEISMLISLGYYGFSKSWSLLPKTIFAFFLIVFAIFLWAFFAAPKSVHRLKMPYLAIFRASIFLIASFLLYQTEQKNIAIAFAVLAIVTQAVSFFAEE